MPRGRKKSAVPPLFSRPLAERPFAGTVIPRRRNGRAAVAAYFGEGSPFRAPLVEVIHPVQAAAFHQPAALFNDLDAQGYWFQSSRLRGSL